MRKKIENDELLSELRALEQQNANLEESLHQATEKGNEKEAMIEKLKNELSTSHNEVRNCDKCNVIDKLILTLV